MVSLVKVVAGVRYWVDCYYSIDNGVTWMQPEDTEENELIVRNIIPCIKFIEEERSWYWCLNIDFNSGRVDNWKNGVCIKSFFKVCDDGHYTVIDDNNNIVWDSKDEKQFYVPDFLELDSSNYGDNIYITINGEGYIKDWNKAKASILDLLDNKQLQLIKA